jgi:hypothetical protein
MRRKKEDFIRIPDRQQEKIPWEGEFTLRKDP